MKPTHCIIHHSATRDGNTLSWNAIRRGHLKKGWDGIGYHIGIEWYAHHSGIYPGHWEMMLGRPFNVPGAHCRQKGMNRKSIGVCFIGDFDHVEPQASMLHFAAERLAPICRLLGIPIDDQHIQAHRDYAPKSCPGRAFDVQLLLERMHHD